MITRNVKDPAIAAAIYDIRTQLPFQINTPDNDLVEAAYDTINRMVILIGDIPFTTLFNMTWLDMHNTPINGMTMPQRFHRADQAGLIDNINDVMSAWTDLVTHPVQMTWTGYINQIRQDGTPGVQGQHQTPTTPIDPDTGLDQHSQMIYRMCRHGIFFPYFRQWTELNTKVVGAHNDLMNDNTVNNLTYLDVVDPGQAVNRGQSSSISNAVAFDILVNPPNHRCCNTLTNICVAGTVTQNCVVCGDSGCVNCG